MLQRYSVRWRIYSWFMNYLPPQLASAGVIAVFPVVTLVGANSQPNHGRHNRPSPLTWRFPIGHKCRFQGAKVEFPAMLTIAPTYKYEERGLKWRHATSSFFTFICNSWILVIDISYSYLYLHGLYSMVSDMYFMTSFVSVLYTLYVSTYNSRTIVPVLVFECFL